MDVTISLKTAEDIVRLLPNISQLDIDERRTFYKFCSAINNVLTMSEFRPISEEVRERKITCIKAYREAFIDENGEYPLLRDSKLVIESRNWFQITDPEAYQKAILAFAEQDIELEYR